MVTNNYERRGKIVKCIICGNKTMIEYWRLRYFCQFTGKEKVMWIRKRP